ncbi:MAG TPA: DUF2085 domain-containing protein [Chloroflexaceae bacterium]|nr:DUF2085 domain-containing protein [Chloroflexaceae bacterium]
MATMTMRRPAAPRPWPTWPLDALLWVLFLGPLISPLFRASGLPLVADAGLLARDLLATYVCPTPERSLTLLGLPMAVCARCWGATIGLWAARLLVAREAAAPTPVLAWFRALPWPARLSLAALPFLLWPLEIVGHYGGWWHAPMGMLLLNGAQAGLAAGLLFCSLWPGLWPARRG